jgi:hypothetical protein
VTVWSQLCQDASTQDRKPRLEARSPRARSMFGERQDGCGRACCPTRLADLSLTRESLPTRASLEGSHLSAICEIAGLDDSVPFIDGKTAPDTDEQDGHYEEKPEGAAPAVASKDGGTRQ